MDPRYDYPAYRVPGARPPMPDPRSAPWGMGPDPGYVSRQPAYGAYPPMPPMPPPPPQDSFPGYGGYPGPEMYPMDSVYFSSGGYFGGDGATFAPPRPEPYRRPVGPVVIEHELRTVGSRKPTTKDADSTRKVTSTTTTTDGAARRNDGRYQTTTEVVRSSDSPSDVIRYPYQKKEDKVQLWREIGTKTLVDEPQRVRPSPRPVQPLGPQLRQEYAMPPVGEDAYYRSDPWPYPMMYPAADRAYVPSGVPAYMMRP